MTSHSRVQRAEECADPTPTPENMWPTAGQLWNQLLEMPGDERLERLGRYINAAADEWMMRFELHDLRKDVRAYHDRAMASEAGWRKVTSALGYGDGITEPQIGHDEFIAEMEQWHRDAEEWRESQREVQR